MYDSLIREGRIGLQRVNGLLLGVGYHSRMRCCLYVLLMLLLPVGGFMGDAMALQLAVHASGQQAMTTSGHARKDLAAVPTHGHLLSASAHKGTDGCAGHGERVKQGSTDDVSLCGECASCQTCHTVAVLLVAGVPDPGQMPPAVPCPVATVFNSADRAPVLKPPAA